MLISIAGNVNHVILPSAAEAKNISAVHFEDTWSSPFSTMGLGTSSQEMTIIPNERKLSGQSLDARPDPWQITFIFVCFLVFSALMLALYRYAYIRRLKDRLRRMEMIQEHTYVNQVYVPYLDDGTQIISDNQPRLVLESSDLPPNVSVDETFSNQFDFSRDVSHQ